MIAVRNIIEGSNLSEQDKRDLLNNIAARPVVVENIAIQPKRRALQIATKEVVEIRVLLIRLLSVFGTPRRLFLRVSLAKPTSVPLRFLEQILTSLPPGQQIHIIADNLSAHRTSRVWQFIETYPHVRIHFTPTSSSWLNQVEIWFSKIQRDVIARGIFCSVKDLAKKLMAYIRRDNAKAKPFKWT
jgi:transposase